MQISASRTLAVAALLLAPALAQTGASLQLEGPATRILTEGLTIPIHATPDGEIWAAGPDYKVRLGREIDFIPVLGPDAAASATWTWRTASVRIGTTVLVDAGTHFRAVVAGPKRFELHYRIAPDQELVEAYDIRADGIEQTFVLQQAPGAGSHGDLVVRGAVRTGLSEVGPHATATPRPVPDRGALTFATATGAADARIDYGEAVAVDTTDRRMRMTTRWRAGTIELRLDADALGTARFPLTVDPLISNATLRGEIAPVTGLDTAFDRATREYLVVYDRATSANDGDTFAILTDANLGNPAVVFADVTTTSTTSAHVGYARGTARWLVAYRETSTVGTSRVRVHDRASGSRSFSSRSQLLTTGLVLAGPVVGGDDTNLGSTALIALAGINAVTAYAYDVANGRIARVESFTPAIIPQQLAINRSGTDGWLLAFSGIAANGANEELHMARFSSAGRLRGSGNAIVDPGRRLTRPAVAGRDGRFLITCESGLPVSFQDTIRAVQVDWGSSTFPATTSRAVIAPNTPVSNYAVEFDVNTASHWTLATARSSNWYATRIGFDLERAEELVIGQRLPADDVLAIAMDPFNRRCALVLPQSRPNPAIRGAIVAAHPEQFVRAGNGCGGSIARNGWATRGSESFGVRLQGGTSGTNAVLFFAAGPANLPLDGLGLPGCALLVDPVTTVPFPAPVSGFFGIATVPLPIPSKTVGTLFFQWVFPQPGANAFGMLTTERLEVTLR
jgi:hypothetical protein